MIHNKELAGKTINVSKELVKEGKVSFDEFGNLEGSISEKAEKSLLGIPGFSDGKSDAKKSLIAPEVEPEPESQEAIELKKVKSELEEAKAKLQEAEENNKGDELKAENAELKKELAKANARIKKLEADLKLAKAK